MVCNKEKLVQCIMKEVNADRKDGRLTRGVLEEEEGETLEE